MYPPLHTASNAKLRKDEKFQLVSDLSPTPKVNSGSYIVLYIKTITNNAVNIKITLRAQFLYVKILLIKYEL